jgi:WXG100 family type VII secretion target
MANIKVDIAVLTKNSQQLSQQINELQLLNNRLDALLTQIDASWDGAASEKYISVMRQHMRKAESMVSVLTEFKNYMEKAASLFSNEDQSGASRIRNS